MSFSPPELHVPGQKLTAFVCVVSATQQGVVQVENATRTYIESGLLLGVEVDGEGPEFFNLSHVWGVWLDWPVKYFGNHRGQQRMGPEFFLEMTWTEWEWLDRHGNKMHRYSPVPIVSSIWCDRAQTEPEVMTAETHLGYSDWFITGWAHKNRVARQKLVESFHYPAMP